VPNSYQQIRYDIAPSFSHRKDEVFGLVRDFCTTGETLFQKRNTIKKMYLGETSVAVKSFRMPGALQSFIYGLWRKSKARRSFEHATKLQQLGISTPSPVAFIEHKQGNCLRDSYYICLFSDSTCDMADILQPYDNSTRSREVVEAFTRFTFGMHENNVLHIDHNAGNTLVTFANDNIEFSVIDINRMRFRPLGIKQRLNNFVRLTDDEHVLTCIAETYAQCSGVPGEYCKSLLAQLKQKHLRKLAIKNKLKSFFRKKRTAR